HPSWFWREKTMIDGAAFVLKQAIVTYMRYRLHCQHPSWFWREKTMIDGAAFVLKQAIVTYMRYRLH
ncbi:hypothetical protein CBL20_25420, partial [Shigella flexneri]